MSKNASKLLSAVIVGVAAIAHAAPYASNVSISGGTSVSFILNEGGSTLTYSINGGPSVALDGTTKGLKSFSLGSSTDTFSITASKTDALGYTMYNGTQVAANANGLSVPSNGGGYSQISENTNVLLRFNSPRGVNVNQNINGANFGSVYVANSAAGSVTASGSFPARTLTGDGLYALRADASDAFGFGAAAQNGGITQWAATPSASAPFRLTTASDGSIYIADFSDATGTVWRMSGGLTGGTNVLAGIGGPTALPSGQNHGSTLGVVPVLSSGGLTLYTVDEDLTTTQTGAGTGTDKNHLWRYDIGTAALPYAAMPVKVNQNSVLLTAATSDLALGADGKFYLAQNRSAGGEAGVVVLNPDGTTAYDSLTKSRELLGNPTAADILRNVLAMDVSPDQKWLAVLLNNSDVAVVPLVGGLPDLANRLVIDTGTDVNSGRDIAFDAVGNLYFASSGRQTLQIMSPGGIQSSTLSYNGTSYSLTSVIPEPASLSSLALSSLLIARRRK